MLRRTPVDVDRRQSRGLSSIVSTLMVSAIGIEIHYLPVMSSIVLCLDLDVWVDTWAGMLVSIEGA